jgi:hypothetical protein
MVGTFQEIRSSDQITAKLGETLTIDAIEEPGLM